MINKRMSAQILALAAPVAAIFIFRAVSAGPAAANAQGAVDQPTATTNSSRSAPTEAQLKAVAWLKSRTPSEHTSPFGATHQDEPEAHTPRTVDAPVVLDLSVTSIMGTGERALVMISGRAHRVGEVVSGDWRLLGVGDDRRSVVLEASDGSQVLLQLDR